MDLNIPRKYIPELLAAIEKNYADKYYVEAPMYTEGYLSSFIQVHRKNTVFQEYRNQKKEQCGIKIDIFIIENTYDNPLQRLRHGVGVQAGLFFCPVTECTLGEMSLRNSHAETVRLVV